MTGCKEVLRDFREENNRRVIVANGKAIDSEGSGTVIFSVQGEAVDNILTAKNVLYVPGLTDNLISVSKLTDSGMEISFKGDHCTASKEGNFVFSGLKVEGMYKMKADVVPVPERADLTKNSQTIMTTLWHRRMAHLNYDALVEMADKGAVGGMPSLSKEPAACQCCIKGKQSREPFTSSTGDHTNQVLDLLHVDVCGPFPVSSVGGNKYVLVIVDDCSRRTSVYFMKSKGEATDLLKTHIRAAENQTGLVVRRVRTDNGREFVNHRLTSFFKENGILHEKTVPYSPAQNGVSERMNRTLVEAARTLLAESQLPAVFWAEAINTAAYVRNRCTHSALQGRVPEQIYTGRYQTVRYFRVFGCVAYAWIPQHSRGKLDSKSRESIFLGYCLDRKGYRLFDPERNQIFVSRDVKFIEERRGSILLDRRTTNKEDYQVIQYIAQLESPAPADLPEPELQIATDISDSTLSTESPSTSSSASSNSVFDSTGGGMSEPEQQHHIPVNAQLRRSTRQRRPPDVLQVDPKRKSYCDMAEVEPSDPRTYDEALNSPQRNEWIAAMEEELSSLHKMRTWTLVPRTAEIKAVKSKWVFRIKRNASGHIDKYKARLVAVGCSQVQGIDFFETFSPVVKLTSMRTLLALGLERNMVMRQLDVKTAYLHGELRETVYMEPPQGYPGSDGTKVCLLNKALYGLRQSGRTWYLTLDEILRKQGYRRLESDRCVYVFRRGREEVILSVYVDDMLMMATTSELLTKAIRDLGKKVELKDLGEPTYILGIEVSHNKQTRSLTIRQRKYIDEILHRFNMQDCKPVKTPMEPGQGETDTTATDAKSAGQGEGQNEEIPFQSLIGNLMYLVQGTRPDIAFATSYLSQFNLHHTYHHWKLAKRVLRYLKGTRDIGITYTACSEPIVGYSDASWNEFGTGKSRSAYVFTMSKGAISWCSTRQRQVSLSTCEAEYIALVDAMKEGKWLKTFTHELGCYDFGTDTMEIKCDNQSAIRIAENPIFHQRTKHIELRYLFARNEIENNQFKVNFLRTDEMVADSLTKPVSSAKNSFCAHGCGLTGL